MKKTKTKKLYTIDWELLGLFIATSFLTGALAGALMIFCILKAVVC